jgi:hypothetical protein
MPCSASRACSTSPISRPRQRRFAGCWHQGGALLVVWRALAHNPVQEALNAAGQFRVGVAPLATAFGLGDVCEVGRLFESAGFNKVTVTDRELVVVFPSRAEFARRMVESVAHSYRSWPGWTRRNARNWQARSTKTPAWPCKHTPGVEDSRAQWLCISSRRAKARADYQACRVRADSLAHYHNDHVHVRRFTSARNASWTCACMCQAT